MTQHAWPAIALARACDGPERIPFRLMDDGGPVLGSVAITHLDALRAWPDAFEVVTAHGGEPEAVLLRLSAPTRDARLAQIHARLREAGLIAGWRDEPY